MARRLVGTLSLGLICASAIALPAGARDQFAAPTLKQAPSAGAALADGTYFFGQAREVGEIGREYLVFTVRDGRVAGAIYAPRSEYSCFTGSAHGGRLALSVVDPYDDQVYPYAIALEARSTLIAGQAQSVVGLEGHHRIDNLRELEYQLLDACEAR